MHENQKTIKICLLLFSCIVYFCHNIHVYNSENHMKYPCHKEEIPSLMILDGQVGGIAAMMNKGKYCSSNKIRKGCKKNDQLWPFIILVFNIR